MYDPNLMSLDLRRITKAISATRALLAACDDAEMAAELEAVLAGEMAEWSTYQATIKAAYAPTPARLARDLADQRGYLRNT
jgi:hypothetical protein